MPRTARIVIEDVPYHVTQRGNRREDVFFTDADRRRYLALLDRYAEQHGLAIHAYCLMTNHVHLVGVPRTAKALAGTLKPVHLRYAQHVHWTQRLTGRLWQGRFFSCGLDDPHYWAAIRYVERNPVRVGLVKRAEQYPWSSAAAHCGLRVEPLLRLTAPAPNAIDDWAAWLQIEDEQTVDALRRNTRTGRPLGSESFIDRLESLLGRTIRPRKAGRHKKGNP